MTPRKQQIAFALISFLVPFCICLLFSLNTWFFYNRDQVEFFSTANYFIHGNGFVNPIKSVFNIANTVPIPALGFRGALYPLLLSIFLKLFTHLLPIKISIIFLDSLVPLVSYLIFSSLMNRKAALIGVLFFFTSPGWIYITRTPWSEPLTCLMWLLVFASWFCLQPSIKRGFLTGVVTAIAWTSKPQLVFFIPLLGLSLLLAGGLKKLFQEKAFWTAIFTFYSLTLAAKLIYHHTTGVWPYEAYSAWLRVPSNNDTLMYQIDFHQPVWKFLTTHVIIVIKKIRANIFEFSTLFITGFYSYFILIFLPVLADGLNPKKAKSPQLFLCLATLFFIFLHWALWSVTDSVRYYLISMLMLHFLCTAYLQKWIERFFMPAIAVFCFIVLPFKVWELRIVMQEYSTHDHPAFQIKSEWILPFCPQFENKVLAASNGQDQFQVCGTPTVILPSDIDNAETLNRFVENEKVNFIITQDSKECAFINTSSNLELMSVSTNPEIRTLYLYRTHLNNADLNLHPVPSFYYLVREEISYMQNPFHVN